MAQQVQVLLIDDLDGSQAGARRPRRAGRHGYEISRTAGHARALRDTWRAAWLPRLDSYGRQSHGGLTHMTL